MKNSSRRLSPVFMVLLATLVLLPAAALAVVVDFPLTANNGALVADKDTRFIALFKQDAESKIITATIQLQNNGGQELAINGIGVQISFSEKIAPYDTEGKKFFSGEISADSEANTNEFAKHCTVLLETFDNLGAQYMLSTAAGGMVAAKLSTAKPEDTLKIAAGKTVSLINFYFMPRNSADLIDIDMFRFEYVFKVDGLSSARHATWLGNGTNLLQPTAANLPVQHTYVVSPGAFKLHVQLQTPTVIANNTARTITGYDPATMEWSNTADGVYRSDVLPIIGNNAQTVYVRAKGDAEYSGDDPLYGAYKKYSASDAVAVVFNATSSKPIWVVTDKNDAYGTKIPSNAHSYDAGEGIVFYWDEKQKDEGVLVVPPEFFNKYKSLTIVVNSSNEYRKLTVTTPGTFDVRKWVDDKGKVHNINAIWVRFNN